MNTRSVVTSPPVVAAFAVLALVLGAIFGVRSSMNNDGDTEVAGTVIERSEIPLATEDPTEEPSEPVVVVRPQPDEEPADEAQVDEAPQGVVAPQDDEPVQVGLIPDDSPPADSDPVTQPRDDGGNTGNNNGDNDPRPRPEPRPEPKPEPSENTRQYELKPGFGHSVHTADSGVDEDGDPYWEFVTLQRHGGAYSDETRAAMARLTVQLTNASVDPDSKRFQCAAWLNAGDRRLIADGTFRVALVQLDENGATSPEDSDYAGHVVYLPQSYDLRAGKSTRSQPMLTEAVDVHPADGFSYTCEAEYVK